MNLQKRFTEQQLERIIDEATIYMCACPAQVAEQIRHLRQMIRYQNNCEIQEDTDTAVPSQRCQGRPAGACHS
jgi:hypothetical protein